MTAVRRLRLALSTLTGAASLALLFVTTPPVSADDARHASAASADNREPTLQSPIDLPPAPPAESPAHRIAIDYEETAEHLIHREHTIEVAYDPGSAMEFDGGRYPLVQIHFHTPSEHLIAHERFPVELHLVHRNDEGRLLVVGILFEVGEANAFLGRILADAPRDLGRVDLERHLNVGDLFPDEKHFYTYQGSLTTAPYTEGVQWLILSEHPSASPEQVVRLLLLEGGNARDVQPLNDRSIEGL